MFTVHSSTQQLNDILLSLYARARVRKRAYLHRSFVLCVSSVRVRRRTRALAKLCYVFARVYTRIRWNCVQSTHALRYIRQQPTSVTRKRVFFLLLLRLVQLSKQNGAIGTACCHASVPAENFCANQTLHAGNL